MSEKNIPYKTYLTEDEMPRTWYNVRADMKVKPAPLLNPGTGAPMGFEDLRGVAESRCCLLKGNELDLEKAAKLLLDDFRNGRLGRITLEKLDNND